MESVSPPLPSNKPNRSFARAKQISYNSAKTGIENEFFPLFGLLSVNEP